MLALMLQHLRTARSLTSGEYVFDAFLGSMAPPSQELEPTANPGQFRAAVARVGYGSAPGELWLLHLSGALWMLAFGGFAVAYFNTLTGPRLAPKEPNQRA